MDGPAYLVVWTDGRKFGPASLEVLRQWAVEGRILPETMLEDSVTGLQATAGSIDPTLFESQPVVSPQAVPRAETMTDPFSTPSSPQQPFEVPSEYPLTSGSPYPVQSYYAKGKSDLSTAWGLVIGGFLATFVSPCCWYILLPGCFALTGCGIYYANKAKKAGEPGAQTVYITGIVAISVQAMLVIGAMIAIAAFFTQLKP